MKNTTVWAFSLLLGLAACSEQQRENMREDTDVTDEPGFGDTGDQELQEEEEPGLQPGTEGSGPGAEAD